MKVSPARLPESDEEKSRLYRRLGRVLEISPREDPPRRGGAAEPCRSPRDGEDGRGARPRVQYVHEHQASFPGVSVEQRLPALVPAQEHRRAPRSASSGEVTPRQLEGQALPRRGAGRPVGQSGHRVLLRPLPARAQRREPRAGGRARPPAASSPLRDPRPGRRCACRSTSACSRPASRRSAATRGAFVAMDVADGEVLALGSSPSFDPNVFAKGDQAGRLQAPQRPATTARRSPTARSRACTRRAPPSS